MNTRHVAALSFTLPFALYAGGCSSASNSLGCPVDPQCYVVSAAGECSVDPSAVCSNGSWVCSKEGKLGSGCLPDGGVVPPPQDAGACVLASLEPPLACNDDSTCLPYEGHCVFDALTGAGSCVCGLPGPDAGPDACVEVCYGDVCSCNGGVCTLPSFSIACDGPGDQTTCAPYLAYCEDTSTGPVCVCAAVDPPQGGVSGPLSQ